MRRMLKEHPAHRPLRYESQLRRQGGGAGPIPGEANPEPHAKASTNLFDQNRIMWEKGF
jgi:hypothetical protein